LIWLPVTVTFTVAVREKVGLLHHTLRLTVPVPPVAAAVNGTVRSAFPLPAKVRGSGRDPEFTDATCPVRDGNRFHVVAKLHKFVTRKRAVPVPPGLAVTGLGGFGTTVTL